MRFDIKQMSKFLTVTVLLLLLSGCGIGITFIGDKQRTYEHPNIAVLKTRGHTVHGFNFPRDPRMIETVKEIKEYWGEPDKRLQLDDNTEQWEYGLDSFRWHGAILWILLIPIPMVIPVGHDYSALFIHNGQVVSVTDVRSGSSDFYCGFLPLDAPSAKSLWRCGKINP